MAEAKRARGRPRKFDEGLALDAAGQVFWEKGFSGASLDELAAAMQMSRPSIYSAFGDKEGVYRKSLDRFTEHMQEAFAATMVAEQDVAAALSAFYMTALNVYTSGEKPLGCMVMSTAVCSAPCHQEIQADLQSVLKTIDQGFEQRFQRAVDEAQLPQDFDIQTRSQLGQGLLHTVSVRARAGESKHSIKKLIDSGVALLLS